MGIQRFAMAPLSILMKITLLSVLLGTAIGESAAHHGQSPLSEFATQSPLSAYLSQMAQSQAKCPNRNLTCPAATQKAVNNDPASLKLHDGSFTVGKGGLLLARDDKSWDRSAVLRITASPVWMITAWLKVDRLDNWLGSYVTIGKAYGFQSAFFARSVGRIKMGIFRATKGHPFAINVEVEGLARMTAPFLPRFRQWFKVGFGTMRKGGKLVAQLYVNGFLFSETNVEVLPVVPYSRHKHRDCKNRSGMPKKTARCKLLYSYMDKGLGWTLKRQTSKKLRVFSGMAVRDVRYFSTGVSKTLAAVPQSSTITLQSFNATHGPCNVHVGEVFVMLDVVERSGMCLQISKNSQPVCSPLQTVGNQKRQTCTKATVVLLNQDQAESAVKLTTSQIKQFGKFRGRKWFNMMTKKKEGWTVLTVGTFSEPFTYAVRLVKSVVCVEEQGAARKQSAMTNARTDKCQVVKAGSCVACKYLPGFWEMYSGVDGHKNKIKTSYLFLKARHKDLCSSPCKKGTNEYLAFQRTLELL